MPVSFSTAASFTDISGSQVIAADLNNDGNLDLVASYFSPGDRTIRFVVLLGNGAGQFNRSLVSPPTGGIVTAIADVNRDGRLDLLLANTTPSGGSISVRLGDGTGRFDQEVISPIPSSAFATFTVADLNRDGQLDVAAIGSGGSLDAFTEAGRAVTILLGDGVGQFGNASTVFAGNANQTPSGIASSDFNRDGIPDLAVFLYSFNNLNTSILLGNGAGGFTNAGTVRATGGGTNTDLLIADFNRDGNPDVGVQGYYLPGKGNGQLGESIFYSSANTLAVGDLNGDGRLDAVGQLSDASNESLLGSLSFLLGGPDNFSLAQSIPAVRDLRSIAVGDFNKDGKLDLAVGTETSGLTVLLNTTAGTDALVFSDRTIDASSQLDAALEVNLTQKTLRLGSISQTLSGDYRSVVGTAQADKMTGDSNLNFFAGAGGNDSLSGLSGNDFLAGGKGVDTLTGGEGKDSFTFSVDSYGSTPYSYGTVSSDASTVFNRSYGVDRITDFTRSQDKITLDRYLFPKLGRRLSFSTVKTRSEAQRSRSIITYIQRTGSLYYNENGVRAGFGTGGQFADLSNGLALQVKDFELQGFVRQ